MMLRLLQWLTLLFMVGIIIMNAMTIHLQREELRSYDTLAALYRARMQELDKVHYELEYLEVV